MNRTYHARSWSAQAREKADNIFNGIMNALERGDTLKIEDHMTDEVRENVTVGEFAAHVLSMSYRADIIRYRAAKRIYRKYKKYLNKR